MLRPSDFGMTGPDVVDLLELLRFAPSPPARPAGAGADPRLFDAMAPAAAAPALALCADCPGVVRSWCWDVVAPGREFVGVAGGRFVYRGQVAA